MKKFLTTIVSLILSAAVTVSCVYALTPSYKVSESYKASEYYKKLTDIKLTGNYIDDITAVALSQVGYHESDDENDLSGSANGYSDYTEYNNWFGRNVGWCAVFISWCARQTGIPESIISNNATADGKGGNFGEKKIYSFSEHRPQKGDIIYISNDDDPEADHVGIVYKVDDTFIYAVEGNTTQQVYDIKYYKDTGIQFYYSTTQIVYYGVPEYGTKPVTPEPEKTYAKGDIDRDGKITSADALLALQSATGLITLKQEQFKLADINSDGVINSNDAIQILIAATSKTKLL